MKKKNRPVGIQAKKSAAFKRMEDKNYIAEMLPRFGTISQSEREKVLKVWNKAEAENDRIYKKKAFNPTSWTEKIWLNFMDYQKLIAIDIPIGNARDFIPTQDYAQELTREFRKR
jgi:hypothetical protein